VLKRYILHTGVDLKAKYIPLRAAQDGVVSFVGYMNGYGKIIIIKHNSGYETRYAHLSVMSTKVGERVKKGELIGKTGASGRVTGPHLHFEIRRNGTPLNPMKYLS
ncbi:MAG: M23 family metallopeptidase, partial [Fusobacterium sp.]|nr:M23 family metallopeptidase [Fusobacterium sp.]